MEALATIITNFVAFLLAGKAVFTLVSDKTGTRFTVRVQAKKGTNDFFFVSVLTGPDNTHDYSYLGTIAGGVYRPDRKYQQISRKAPSRLAAEWAIKRALAGQELTSCTVYHENRCGRCARSLTTPESITSGYGPHCRSMVA